ncbi:MAG TPA: hypothetical protein VHT26_20440 [Trebonia sp.]|nr:hypothetical protein [Trebonia sp.]
MASGYDCDGHVLRIGGRDVSGLPDLPVVGEAVLLSVDGVLVQELGVLACGAGLVTALVSIACVTLAFAPRKRRYVRCRRW